jgi:lipoprotein signal peptidase
MARSALALALTALVVAGADLVHAGLAVANSSGGTLAHERSLPYVVGVAAASLLWAGAIVLTRSTSIAVAGGVLAGGALGNLASLALWPSLNGVPDPLVAAGVAFSLADVAVAVGLVLVLATTAVFAARNRARLRDPIRLGA